MKASLAWLDTIGAEYSAGNGIGGFAHLTHYTVEYREWGSGPPLVLIPGMAGGFELLGPLAKILAKNYRVISYQLRGEDNCFALRSPFGIDDLVGDLAEFLEWMCLENPTIFGVSFGGVLALEYAARHHYRLDRLIVQGVGACFERGLFQQIAGTVLSRFPLPVDNPFINQFFNLLFGNKPDNPPLVDFVTRQCWQTDQSVMAHRFKIVESYDIQPRLQRIRVPSLVMAGDRDMLVSQRSLARLCNGLDNVQFARLPAAGHLAFVTKPELVAEKVQQFLAS